MVAVDGQNGIAFQVQRSMAGMRCFNDMYSNNCEVTYEQTYETANKRSRCTRVFVRNMVYYG